MPIDLSRFETVEDVSLAIQVHAHELRKRAAKLERLRIDLEELKEKADTRNAQRFAYNAQIQLMEENLARMTPDNPRYSTTDSILQRTRMNLQNIDLKYSKSTPRDQLNLELEISVLEYHTQLLVEVLALLEARMVELSPS